MSFPQLGLSSAPILSLHTAHCSVVRLFTSTFLEKATKLVCTVFNKKCLGNTLFGGEVELTTMKHRQPTGHSEAPLHLRKDSKLAKNGSNQTTTCQTRCAIWGPSNSPCQDFNRSKIDLNWVQT